MITALLIICGSGILILLYFMFKGPTEELKDELQRLKESLEDDRIFDPETGVYISLEEAESGQWSTDDREKHYIPEQQLSKEGDNLKIAINYLYNSEFYTKTGPLPDTEYDIIESSKILGKYDDWSYSNTLKFEKGYAFLPLVDEGVDGSLLMYLIKIPSLKGHYYLREKEAAEKFFDHFRDDDDLTLKNYESFTLRKSKNTHMINNFLKVFEGEKGLEIEINDTFLMIKTLKLVNLEDILRIEKIIKRM
jgi:hypothetical protein